MKIKVIFTQPPYAALKSFAASETQDKVIFIKDPYVITMENDSRSIVSEDGLHITYEKYGVKLKKIIEDTIHSQKLGNVSSCNDITVESCKEPPNFKHLNNALAKAEISFSSPCTIIFKNCSFGGTLYVDSTITLVNSALKHRKPVFFNIIVEDNRDKSIITEQDEAKLTALTNIACFMSIQSYATQCLTDNQAIDNQKTRRILVRLGQPTYFYHSLLKQTMLMTFFSQAHQQQSDYTCGPAVLKMIADYYTFMAKQSFCGDDISAHHKHAFEILNSTTELEMAKKMGTREKTGTEISDIRDGLMAFGFSIIDNSDGFTTHDYKKIELKIHKERLWNKLKKILNLDIPVIINLQDKTGIGHYEVALGINKQEKIILAEPGAALGGKVEFDTVSKAQFIKRWKNMDGKRHGRFLILPPNKTSAEKIEAILTGFSHYYNGEKKNYPKV